MKSERHPRKELKTLDNEKKIDPALTEEETELSSEETELPEEGSSGSETSGVSTFPQPESKRAKTSEKTKSFFKMEHLRFIKLPYI